MNKGEIAWKIFCKEAVDSELTAWQLPVAFQTMQSLQKLMKAELHTFLAAKRGTGGDFMKSFVCGLVAFSTMINFVQSCPVEQLKAHAEEMAAGDPELKTLLDALLEAQKGR